MPQKKNSHKDLILEGERLDDLQCGGLFIIQDPSTFCFGMDAVLLADFARVKAGGDLLDLCTGNGIVPLLTSVKTRAGRISGIELQPKIAAMAERSVRYNALEDRVSIICGDLREEESFRRAKAAGKAQCASGTSEPRADGKSQKDPLLWDTITANPPYLAAGAGLVNENEALRIARHEENGTLAEIVAQAARHLKVHGRACFVYRPARLAELFFEMKKNRLEPKRLRMVHSYADSPAALVLAEGVLGGGIELKAEPPLIVYERKDRYTREILEIYGKTD